MRSSVSWPAPSAAISSTMPASFAQSSDSSRATNVRTKSCLISLMSMPKAHSTELSRGTICSGISSSWQIRHAWMGPAPPAGMIGNSRGSNPRLIVTSRTPCAMLLHATRYIPAAASSIVRPMGRAMCVSMAARAAATSNFILPPAKNSGSR